MSIDVFFKIRMPNDSLCRVRPYPGANRALLPVPRLSRHLVTLLIRMIYRRTVASAGALGNSPGTGALSLQTSRFVSVRTMLR